MIRTGMWILGTLMAVSAQAAERQVYLVATVQLDGSSLAHSIFLHEPDITDLQGCLDAVRDGQSKRDWLRYHHIFRSDRFKGFSGHRRYRCAYSEQRFSGWHDGPRYNKPYLIGVDDDAQLSVARMASQAECMAELRSLPEARQAQSFCAVGNQELKR